MNRSTPRDRSWSGMLAEGLTIVLSILLAFAIDAWWDGRHDRAREDAYLRMLAADLRQTLDNNAMFGARADSIDWAGARLLRAYYEPEVPPRDSLQRWITLALGWWVVQPTLGTAQTLVMTGDLRLVRSDSIRAAIPRYLTVMTAFDGFELQGQDMWQEAVDRLADRVGPELTLLRLARTPAAARDSLAAADPLYPFPAGPMRSLPSTDLTPLVRDEELHELLRRMNSGKIFMRTYRGLMRDVSQRLLELVEAGAT